MILFTLLFGQRMLLGTLFRQERMGVELNESLVSRICFQQSFRSDMDTGILEQLEIVFLPIGKGQAKNLTVLEIDQHLGFQCMPLFLPGIVPLLLFLGRSMGDSVASTRIASYSISLFSAAFRPGSEKVPSWSSVSSTHLIPR